MDFENEDEIDPTQIDPTQTNPEDTMRNSSRGDIAGDNSSDPSILLSNVWGQLRRQDQLMDVDLVHREKDGLKDTFCLGRMPAMCDVVVKHKSVSKRHCLIYCDYSQPRMRVFVEGLSTGGTFVNSSFIRIVPGQRFELRTGDELFLLNPSSTYTKPEDVTKTSFLFINLRERWIVQREVAPAPPSHPASAPSHSSGSGQGPSLQERSSNLDVGPPPLAPRHVEDYFIIGESLGHGMCGQVHHCLQKSTGLHCVSMCVCLCVYVCVCAGVSVFVCV